MRHAQMDMWVLLLIIIDDLVQDVIRIAAALKRNAQQNAMWCGERIGRRDAGKDFWGIDKQAAKNKQERKARNSLDHEYHPEQHMQLVFIGFKKVQKKFKKGVDKRLVK